MIKLERIPTAIPGFDALVQGGFKKSSTNLLVGGAGSGKTIFAIQFLVNGIEKYNEPGVFITFEEKKKKTYEDMLEFGWDLKKYEKEGKFTYLEYTPEQVKKVIVEGGGALESVIIETKAKRVVIDSISSFALLYKDELLKKEASLVLFELLNKWGCTALLTSQDELHTASDVFSALEFEVDSIILLYHAKIKGIRHRSLEILKMRGTRHPEKTFRFEITDKGIHVTLTKVIEE